MHTARVRLSSILRLGLFAEVLRELGFTVDLLEARVGGNAWEDSLPWDHVMLLVTLEERWLADEAEFLQVLRERSGIEP